MNCCPWYLWGTICTGLVNVELVKGVVFGFTVGFDGHLQEFLVVYTKQWFIWLYGGVGVFSVASTAVWRFRIEKNRGAWALRFFCAVHTVHHNMIPN